MKSRAIAVATLVLIAVGARAEEPTVTIAARRLASGAIGIRLTNAGENPIVVDRLLRLFVRITVVGSANTAIPLQEGAKLERWGEAERAGRLVRVAPGGAIEREIRLDGAFWSFVGAASFPEGGSFLYEAEAALPAASTPARVVVEYGAGRFRTEAMAFTGLTEPAFDAIFRQDLGCSLDLGPAVK